MEKITLSESELINAIQKVIKEDAGKDTPGGNPEYFYGGSSLDKLRNMNQDEMKEDISRDGIIEILNEIYELQLQKAPAIAQRRLDELFEKVGIGYWSYPSPKGGTMEEGVGGNIPVLSKKIKLTEVQLSRIVDKVLKEQGEGKTR